MIKRVILSALVFVFFMSCGLLVASKKLLWSDELLTQQNTIDRLDYLGILRMDFPEGNLSPLFYLGQKFICQLTGYRLPVVWKGEFCVYEPTGQVILRIFPVMYMSLAAAIVFFYFYSRFSLGMAGAALLTMMSCFSFWVFMPEARPYSLWFLLCSLQGLFFMEVLRAVGWSACTKWLVWLGVANWLMSLTIIFAAIPIAATTAVIFTRYRRQFFLSSLWLAGLPIIICWIYYYVSKKTFASMNAVLPQDPAGVAFLVVDGMGRAIQGLQWVNYIFLNINPYCLLFILAGSSVYFLKGRHQAGAAQVVLPGMLASWAAMLLGAFVLLSSLLSWETRKAGVVAERYFLFLAPATILIVLMMFGAFLNSSQGNRPLRLLLWAVFTGVMVLSTLWSVTHMLTWGPFWSL